VRDLERKLRTDLARTILELEASTRAQASARRAELSHLSVDDLRAVIQRLRGKRSGKRGEEASAAVVVRAMLASEEEWLTMREIADQSLALGHAIETERVSTALANLEFASGRGSGMHDGYSVEVLRKRRPFLYRLVPRAPDVPTLADILVATGWRLWSTTHNNTPAAQIVYRWMRAVAPGHFVLEVTSAQGRQAIDRVGELVSITSGHEYTLRTIDGRELRWENADFVRIPRGEADNREIFSLGERSAL
jgi:hypothetical protein